MFCQRISKLYKIVPYGPNMWNTYVLTASNLPHGFFFFFLFPSHPYGVLVSVLPSVLCSMLLGFIRYWFFSFDFVFDYLILFLSFDHFLGFFILFYLFIYLFFRLHLSFSVHILGFISGSLFRDFIGKW